jgi:hypothetical protein
MDTMTVAWRPQRHRELQAGRIRDNAKAMVDPDHVRSRV